MKWIKLMRVRHYLKNTLVFAALACSGKLFEKGYFLNGCMGFLAFCAVSSAVYIVNDIMDREQDRRHPVKCSRPIASGAVTVPQGLILAAALLCLAGVCSVLTRHPLSALWLALYFALNVGYSMGLKDLPLVDVSILASGFVIRMVYGAMVTDIAISRWLYLTVIVGALYCALGKRRNEAKKLGDGQTRKVLKLYTADFLDKNMYMCLGLVNVFYALWSMDTSTMALYRNEYMFFTIPVVLLITMRYSMDLENGSDGDPVELLLHDKALMGLCGLYLLSMFLILYVV